MGCLSPLSHSRLFKPQLKGDNMTWRAEKLLNSAYLVSSWKSSITLWLKENQPMSLLEHGLRKLWCIKNCNILTKPIFLPGKHWSSSRHSYRNMKIVENITKFAKETSIHGFVHMANSTSTKAKRITWFLLFMSSLIYAGVQISEEAKCKNILLETCDWKLSTIHAF